MIQNTRSGDQPTDRGVSEVMGFVIVFGIIIGSVGFLYMTGFQAMGDFQQHEQQKNADYAMDALAENFNDIVRNDGVLERSGELNLREGTIRTDSDGPIENVTVDGDNILDDHLGEDLSGMGAFTYTYEGNTVAYQGGGVVKTDGSGAITVRDPLIQCHDGVAIVSLVVVDGDDTSLMSHGGLEITAIDRGTTVENGSDLELEFDTDSEYYPAWNRTLESRGFETNGGTITCEDPDHVVVRITTIEIDYN